MLEDDRARELINIAAEAAKAGSRADARGLLQRALATSPSVGLRIRAWRNLAHLTDDPAEKRACLENILLADSTDGLARRDLAILDGTLNEHDIVDPNQARQASPAQAPPEDVEAEQLVCLSCGAGRLVYSPTTGTLVCAHCRRERPVGENAHPMAHDDFAAAMWTGRSRKAPTAQQVVTCSRCGAVFVVKPAILSVTCLYCGTNTTIQQAEARDLLLPDGIMPLSVTREEAQELVRAAKKEQPGQEMSGGYVPVWIFSFAGQVEWTGMAHRQLGNSDSRPEIVDGTYTVVEMTVPVFGASRLAEFADFALQQMDFSRIAPFDDEFLTGWPAESYDITLEQASVAARPRAIEKTRAEVIESTIDEATRIQVSTGSLGIDTFRLVLAPVWLVSSSDHRPSLILDGCTGQVYGKSGGGIFERLRQTLGMD